jgi:diaminohydroxyphosphoribosylaminopyrimidine deaminase / 5-amino-6-(5-phosphoribosylamino)uracil reductase
VVDDRLMHRAIQLAQEWPYTHPNPRVGAVVADDSGRVVGEGWHRGPGTDHAEVVALEEAGDSARYATVYVTLEPCTHHGRTPPCVDALTAAGVSKVVVGAIDPDSNVSGDGVRRLEEAGIEVVTGVAEAQARQVDPAYFHHRETGMPIVTAKWAMTIDGSVAAHDGTSQWMTGGLAREDAHDLRSRVDGVVVGAGTVRADNPRLDVRIDGFEGIQPRPIIVAGEEELPPDAALWQREPVIVGISDRPVPSGEVLVVPESGGYPDPEQTCRRLAELGMLHLLLEGGPTLTGSWWRAGVISNGIVYIGAKVGAGSGRSPLAGLFATMKDAVDVEFEEVRSVGGDVLIAFRNKERP